MGDATGHGVRNCLNGILYDSFTCTGKSCSGLDLIAMPQNGSLGECDRGFIPGTNRTAPLSHGKSCTPQCDHGYEASGTRSCFAGTLTDTFKCTPITCDASKEPIHGHKGDCSGTLAPWSTCQPVCDDGWENRNNGYRSCFFGEYQD